MEFQKDYFKGLFLAPEFQNVVHHSWEVVAEQNCSHQKALRARLGSKHATLCTPITVSEAQQGQACLGI